MVNQEHEIRLRHVQFFHVRILLRMTKAAQLHALHAPALYALLSAAYGTARNVSPVMPDGVLLSAPEQCRIHLAKDDRYAFGLTILAYSTRESAERLDQLLDGLRALGRRAAGKGAAFGGNFSIAAVEDLVSATPRITGQGLTPVPWDQLAVEVERLKHCQQLTLRFTAPLRCHRSKHSRGAGHGHFDREYFDARAFIERLTARLRALGVVSPEFNVAGEMPRVVSNRLVWIDASYGPREHRKALGGALGRVVLTSCSPSISEALVWGQHVRVGGQTRFGFGAYRIEELGAYPFACRRASSVLELVDNSAAFDLAAATVDIESGSLREALRNVQAGSYVPQPHFQLTITSPSGKTRTLAIPSHQDRALQRMVLAQITPGIDTFLEDSSLAYRRGLGRQRAAMRIRDAYRRGFKWAVKADFTSFFDNVDHVELLSRLEAYIGDDELVTLIMRWIKAGSPAAERGLPTGAPLSPLLANVLLDQFDEEVESQQGFLVRYADDFLILFQQREQATAIYELARQAAADLQLELNQSKTKLVELSEPFDFLGFRFQKRDAWEASAGGEPIQLEDLGWHDSAQGKPTPIAEKRLPGESSLNPKSALGTVIWGPAVSSLRTQGNQLICAHSDGRAPARVPLGRVRELFVLGRPTIDATALKALSQFEISVHLTDDLGRIQATISPDMPLENAAAVSGQISASSDVAWRLEISRKVINAKLQNYAALSDEYLGRERDWSTGRELRRLANAALQAESVEQLLGLEGAGAARWYGEFAHRLPTHFGFTQRIAPAADDPINILLNLAYTVLYRHIVVMIRQAGLVPSIGILHRPHSGHAALASDLQEPFRHLMDRAVLETASRVRPSDFVPSDDDQYPIRILPRAMRELLARVHQILAIPCQGKAQSEPKPYRQQIQGLIRALRLHLLDRGQPFDVWEHP